MSAYGPAHAQYKESAQYLTSTSRDGIAIRLRARDLLPHNRDKIGVEVKNLRSWLASMDSAVKLHQQTMAVLRCPDMAGLDTPLGQEPHR